MIPGTSAIRRLSYLWISSLSKQHTTSRQPHCITLYRLLHLLNQLCLPQIDHMIMSGDSEAYSSSTDTNGDTDDYTIYGSLLAPAPSQRGCPPYHKRLGGLLGWFASLSHFFTFARQTRGTLGWHHRVSSCFLSHQWLSWILLIPARWHTGTSASLSA